MMNEKQREELRAALWELNIDLTHALRKQLKGSKVKAATLDCARAHLLANGIVLDRTATKYDIYEELEALAASSDELPFPEFDDE